MARAKDEIGFSGEVFAVQPVAIAEAVDEAV